MTEPQITDSPCHLDFPDFEGETADLVAEEGHPEHESDHRDHVGDERRPGRANPADEAAHDHEGDAGAQHARSGDGALAAIVREAL